MEQKLELIQKKLTKPSELLREAHRQGLKHIQGHVKLGDSYCALGAMFKVFGDLRGYELNDNKVCVHYKNGVNAYKVFLELVEENGAKYELKSLLSNELVRFNDSKDKPSLLECADFLEEKGF